MLLDFAKYPLDLENLDIWCCWLFLDKKKSKYIMGKLNEKTEIIPCLINHQLYTNYGSSTANYYKNLLFDPIEQRYCLVYGGGTVGTAVYCFKLSNGNLSYQNLYYQTAKDADEYPVLTLNSPAVKQDSSYLYRNFSLQSIFQKNGRYKIGLLGGERSDFDIELGELSTQNQVEKEGLSQYSTSGTETHASYVFQTRMICGNQYYGGSNQYFIWYRANTSEYFQSIDYDYLKGYSDKEICGIYVCFGYNTNSTQGYITNPQNPSTGHNTFINDRCPVLVGSRVFKFDFAPFGYDGEFTCIRPFRNNYSKFVTYDNHDGKRIASYLMTTINVPYYNAKAPKIVAFVNNGKEWNGIDMESGFYIFEDNRETVFGEPCSYFFCPFDNAQTQAKNHTTDWNLFNYNLFPGYGFSDYSNWTFTFHFVPKNDNDINPGYAPITYSYCGLTMQKNQAINELNNYYVLTDSYILFDNHYSNLTNYNYDHNKSYFGVMDDVFNLQGFYEKEKTE